MLQPWRTRCAVLRLDDERCKECFRYRKCSAEVSKPAAQVCFQSLTIERIAQLCSMTTLERPRTGLLSRVFDGSGGYVAFHSN